MPTDSVAARNASALGEAGPAALARAGFTGPDGDAALAAVNDQVVGSVVAETAWRASLRHAGDADERDVGEHVRRVAREHPHLAARAEAPGPVDVDAECERRFAFALDCLLDVLAARRAWPARRRRTGGDRKSGSRDPPSFARAMADRKRGPFRSLNCADCGRPKWRLPRCGRGHAVTWRPWRPFCSVLDTIAVYRVVCSDI
ncbi:TetR/AcrR family transcriptional regulator C-terminal domain-containing protein [Actinomadura sp. WAC 06369]|uniref:TetR/AcrR family transcriptional regulator C-terminal domain-containing protein n=1 Tax=Actinomadura sp. WAC 06369 TaxID=2203193 RepID=UPI000F7B1FC8|nr:TetR/AcrR family transcriptional regulator C-terminal domain-containing protein [Actinomadura sp. WAC 06369]